MLMNEEGVYFGSIAQKWFQVPYINYGKQMDPGNYILVVDPTWNEQASLEPGYKDLHIDIYTN